MPPLRFHLGNGHTLTIPSGQFESVESVHDHLERPAGVTTPWWHIHAYGALADTIALSPDPQSSGGLDPKLPLHEVCLRRDDILAVEALVPTPASSVQMVTTTAYPLA